MILTPFRIVYDLIMFALQAAFVYGLMIIGGIVIFAWLMTGAEPTVVYEYVEVIKPTIEPILECLRLDGCALNFAAETMEEYCPSCVIRK